MTGACRGAQPATAARPGSAGSPNRGSPVPSPRSALRSGRQRTGVFPCEDTSAIAGFLEFLLQSRGRGPAARTHDPYPGQAAKPALTGPDAVRLPGPRRRAGPQGSWFGGSTRTLPPSLPRPRPAPPKQAPRDAAGGPATSAPDDQPGANLIVTHV